MIATSLYTDEMRVANISLLSASPRMYFACGDDRWRLWAGKIELQTWCGRKLFGLTIQSSCWLFEFVIPKLVCVIQLQARSSLQERLLICQATGTE